MKKIPIHTEYIKLSQLLKLANLIDQGSDTKWYLSQGKIKLNGEIVTERGKKIHPGDKVEVLGQDIVLVTKEE